MASLPAINIPVPTSHAYSHAMQGPFGGTGSDIVSKGNALMTQAMNAANQLAALAGNLQVPAIQPLFPTIAAAPKPVTATMPALGTVAWSPPPRPAALALSIPDLTGLLPGPFTGTAPTLAFGSLPAPDFGTAPDAPAINLNFQYPTLSVNLPQAPSLLSISSFSFTDPVLPKFDAKLPVLNLLPPNPILYTEGPLYTSTLLTMLQQDLQKAIANGTAISLPTAALQGQFDAASEREFYAQRDALNELDKMEQTGFAMPPGVWLDARLKITLETNNKRTGLSRDIMVKSAELTLENLVKARDSAASLESRLIEYANSVSQRAFEACKYESETLVAIYNSGVESYKAGVAAYTAQAQVYDYQIRGALAIAEIYKTKVEAEGLKAQANESLVRMYQSEVQAALANVEIYKAELSAIETQANIQKLIVESYGEQIKAFVGKVNAYTAEVEAYRASTQAQGTIQETYTASVNAYRATVEAGSVQVDARVKVIDAQIKNYQSQLEGYKADLQALVEQARATSEYNTSQAEVFRAIVQGDAAYNEVLTKQWQAVIDTNEKVAEVGVKAAEANIQAMLQAKQIAVEAGKTTAQVAAQLGAAAFNAIHFSNSASWSSSGSQSYSESLSGALSASVSASDSHSQSESV